MASWLLQYWLQCGYPSKESEVQKQISNADRFVHLNCIIFRRSVRIMKIRHGYKYHFSLVLLPQSRLCTDLLRQIFSQVKSPKGWQANMLSEPAGTSIKTTSDLNWHFPNTAVWNNIKNEIYSALMLWFCHLRLFCQCLTLRSSPICLHIQFVVFFILSAMCLRLWVSDSRLLRHLACDVPGETAALLCQMPHVLIASSFHNSCPISWLLGLLIGAGRRESTEPIGVLEVEPLIRGDGLWC